MMKHSRSSGELSRSLTGSFTHALKYVSTRKLKLESPSDVASSSSSSRSNDEDDDDDDNEEVADERRLHRAVRDAGRYANGVSAVEVWILEESTGTASTSPTAVDNGSGRISSGPGLHLVQPRGGWWRSPSFPHTDALGRIEDGNRDDYVPPRPQLPGTGLAGKLWCELQVRDGGDNSHHHPNRPHNSRLSMHLPRPWLGRGGNNRHGGHNAHKGDHDNDDEGSLDNSARSHSFMFLSLRSDPGIGFGLGDKNKRKRRQLIKSVNQKLQDEKLEQGLNVNANDNAKNEPNETPIADHEHHHHHHHLNTNDEHQQGPPTLLWRDIHSLTIDPDQPTFERLKLLEEAGFHQAAGVRFDIPRGGGNTKGVVIFLATSDDRSEEVLSRPENCAYMKSAAEFIAAAAAMTKPRKELVAHNAQVVAKNALPDDKNDKPTIDAAAIEDHNALMHKLKIWASKCRGGDLQPPPPMASGEASLTFFGAFATLLVLSRVSLALRAVSHGDLGIILGPFGALMTLQYGLVMAPASQPRNVLYGLATGVTIALLFAYIPEEHLPLWVRVPLATATAIAALVRLGITHPPAGAAALIVSSGGYSWVDLPLILLGGVISIAIATLINNVSERRQYPTYYHFGGGMMDVMVTKPLRSLSTNIRRDDEPRSDEDSTADGSTADKKQGIETSEVLFHPSIVSEE